MGQHTKDCSRCNNSHCKQCGAKGVWDQHSDSLSVCRATSPCGKCVPWCQGHSKVRHSGAAHRQVVPKFRGGSTCYHCSDITAEEKTPDNSLRFVVKAGWGTETTPETQLSAILDAFSNWSESWAYTVNLKHTSTIVSVWPVVSKWGNWPQLTVDSRPKLSSQSSLGPI